MHTISISFSIHFPNICYEYYELVSDTGANTFSVYAKRSNDCHKMLSLCLIKANLCARTFIYQLVQYMQMNTYFFFINCSKNGALTFAAAPCPKNTAPVV
mmetsp:Transcript_51857/g.102383  ORF Transcript_51857/g.102383 Transcript_51857/m.102383 type:complete len:100 (+) Transcript_51857:59-358(+)